MSARCALPMRFLLVAAFAGSLVPLPAQQAAPSSQKPPASDSGLLTFRKNVHRVVLDVVVTDAHEKPVRGLTRDDFTVAEDGKTQRVLSFDVHDFDTVPEAPKVPPLPPNTFMNVPAAPERGPLYVILYDMVNMNLDDQARARIQLLKFIADKPAGVRFAIFVLSDGLRLVQGFTDDQAELFAAMDPNRPRAHVPKIFLYGQNYGQGEIRLLRWVFTRIAHFMDALPGRKNVIWLTGSVPTSILASADPNNEPLSFSDEVKEAINAMARSQIAVYPVDVRGVVPVAVSSSPQPGPGGTAMVTSSDNPYLAESYLTEGDIAGSTGGHAFFGTNDLKSALEEATETGANYYTLSYSPSNQTYDGQLRKLHVELSKHGYHLAYRRSYFAYNPDAPPPSGKRKASALAQEAVPRDSLFVNMQHGAPLTHQLLFKAHIRPVGLPAQATPEQMTNLGEQPEDFRAHRKNRPVKARLPIQLQSYVIDYTVLVNPIRQDRNRQPFTLEVAAAAYDGEGDMLNVALENAAEASSAYAEEGLPGAPAGSDSGSDKVKAREFRRAQLLIDVPLNATSIRMAAHDVSTDRVGAMEVLLPLAREPETEADGPTDTGHPASAETARPKPD